MCPPVVGAVPSQAYPNRAPVTRQTSHRAGSRFGPGLGDLRVYDAADVEMFSGDAERSVRDLRAAPRYGRAVASASRVAQPGATPTQGPLPDITASAEVFSRQ